MALRALVPTDQLADAVRGPGITPILWSLDDSPEEAPEAEALITERPRDPQQRSRLAQIPGLRHVHLLSIGHEWIWDHLPDGVSVSNSRGAVEDATAELALALALASIRKLPVALEQQRERTWSPVWTDSLHGADALILGHGGVGREIIARLEPFRPRRIIRVASRARTEGPGPAVHGVDELPALVGQADVVFVAVPDTPATVGLVDAELLAGMREGALLVNVGRGKVVDTTALLRELERGRIRAALDVVDPEPLPADHPLWSAPNCLVTPHMAGNTHQFVRIATEIAVDQLQRLAEGRDPVNLVRGA